MPLLAHLGLVLAAGLGGVCFVLQQVANASFRRDIGSPYWAGLVSTLGAVVTMLVIAALMRQRLPTLAALARTNWFSWTGGVFAALYVLAAILLIPRLGVASTVALIVTGQMLGSIAIDHFGWFGVLPQALTLVRAAGAALLVLGVILINR